jgi:hypothetical protein
MPEPGIDAAKFPAHTFTYGKEIRRENFKWDERSRKPVFADGHHRGSGEDARPTSRTAKPSALLDIRVIYCRDNLEQPERMQKEECRMMKPARFPILHSAFLIHP